MEKYKSSSENGTAKNSEEERLNALVSSVAHRFIIDNANFYLDPNPHHSLTNCIFIIIEPIEI